MVQIADVLLKKLYEKTFLPIEVGGDGLSKVALDRRDSFLPVFVGQ
jgi:hypothetical protein